tara:strand:+ start:205 stop:780 length:576 start_codon:yes stop_codon:yes gene_type:complete
MMISVDILNDKKVIAALKKMDSFAAPDALRKALRDTSKKAPPRLSKEIRQEYTLTAKRIKRDIRIKPLEQGFKYLVSVSHRPITVMQYKMKPNPWRKMPQGGLGFSIYKGQKEFVKGGFVAEGKQGINLPFKRVGPRPRPFYTLYGPSIAGIVRGDSKFGGSIMGRVERELTAGLSAAVNRRFGAFLRGYG